MSKKIPVLVSIVVVILAAAIAGSRSAPKSNSQPESPTPNAIPEIQPNPQAQGPSGYTLAQVAGHRDISSCWSAVNGSVFDLTKWIAEHPGGEEAILSICGKDGSAAFNDQHSGQGKPEGVLESFRIGALIK